MRKLIILVVVAALAYSGYWFVGKSQITSVLEQALIDIDASEYDLSYDTLHTRGFPSRFDTTITDLEFNDPATGMTWTAPLFQLFALSYRPNEVIAVFPNEQTLTVDGELFTLFTNDMRASGKVSANTTLAFQTATIEMENPRIRTEEGAELAMASVLAAMRLTPETTQTYDVFLEARSIVLPEDIRRMIDPQNQQPPIIQNLRFEGDMTLDAPIELNGDASEAQIETLSITELKLTWGEMSLTAIGDATPDGNGVLNGSITLTALNWKQGISLGISNGMIEADKQYLVEGIASALDETPDFPDTLTLTLQIIDGMMALGGMDLGPAPTLN